MRNEELGMRNEGPQAGVVTQHYGEAVRLEEKETAGFTGWPQAGVVTQHYGEAVPLKRKKTVIMNFGFKLSKSSTVDLNNVDTHLYQHLCELEPDIKICMNCGSCGASCTAAPFSGMSIRKLILGLQRQQDVRKMLSNCMLCGKCTMVCPRGINTRKLLLTLSKIYD